MCTRHYSLYYLAYRMAGFRIRVRVVRETCRSPYPPIRGLTKTQKQLDFLWLFGKKISLEQAGIEFARLHNARGRIWTSGRHSAMR